MTTAESGEGPSAEGETAAAAASPNEQPVVDETANEGIEAEAEGDEVREDSNKSLALPLLVRLLQRGPRPWRTAR